MDLYKRAIQYENDGKINEATNLYRQALRKDPGVDSEYSSLELSKHEVAITRKSQPASVSLWLSSEIASKIRELPEELLSVVFKWMLYSDITEIVTLSLVGGAVQRHATGALVWKRLCEIAHEGVQLCSQIDSFNNDWMNLWKCKPHLRDDGVYISKVTYFRQVLNHSEAPMHFVTYYRYLRFVGQNSCLVFTNSLEPKKVVQVSYHLPRNWMLMQTLKACSWPFG